MNCTMEQGTKGVYKTLALTTGNPVQAAQATQSDF